MAFSKKCWCNPAIGGSVWPPPAGAPEPSTGSTAAETSNGAHRSLWVMKSQRSSPFCCAAVGSTLQNHLLGAPLAPIEPVIAKAAWPS